MFTVVVGTAAEGVPEDTRSSLSASLQEIAAAVATMPLGSMFWHSVRGLKAAPGPGWLAVLVRGRARGASRQLGEVPADRRLVRCLSVRCRRGLLRPQPLLLRLRVLLQPILDLPRRDLQQICRAGGGAAHQLE